MEAITQEQVDSAVVTYFENQTHHTGETVKAMLVVGLLMVGTYTTAKTVTHVVANVISNRRELKKLKKANKSNS